MNKKFEIFCDELLKWNKIHNLTGYKTKDLVFENIFDSIYPLKFINDFKSAIDIGSGNGFPAARGTVREESGRLRQNHSGSEQGNREQVHHLQSLP